MLDPLSVPHPLYANKSQQSRTAFNGNSAQSRTIIKPPWDLNSSRKNNQWLYSFCIFAEILPYLPAFFEKSSHITQLSKEIHS
jgi:hypothetical protein